MYSNILHRFEKLIFLLSASFIIKTVGILLKDDHGLIMGKQCCHYFSAIVDQIIFIFVSGFCFVLCFY